MSFFNFLSMIEEHVVLPLVIAFGAAILYFCKHYFDKVSKSMVAKNELEEMEKQASIRNQLMQTISESVKAAVGSNMQMAEEMKSGGNKLDEYQIQQLNESAKSIVIGSLPPSLTENEGVLLDFIGSREKLDNLISALMEKYVYEYKINHQKKDGAAETPSEVPNTEEVPDNTSEADETTQETYNEPCEATETTEEPAPEIIDNFVPNDENSMNMEDQIAVDTEVSEEIPEETVQEAPKKKIEITPVLH